MHELGSGWVPIGAFVPWSELPQPITAQLQLTTGSNPANADQGKKMIGVTNPTRISKHTKHGTPTKKAPIPIPTERRNETEL